MKRLSERAATGVAWLSGGGLVLALAVVIGFLILRGYENLNLALFFGDTPWKAAIRGDKPVFGGIWPALMGTFYLVVLSSAMAIPIGIASGIYLAEYASRRLRSFLGFFVDVLAGTPSIVMGLFGFTAILFLRKTLLPAAQTCLLLAAACIALLVLPYVIRITETSIGAIPEPLRLLGTSVGFTRWRNLRSVLLPLASRGMLSGAILAVGRASEDTAVILLTGVVAHAGVPGSMFDKFEALPFRIYYLAAEYRNPGELDQGFATSLVLLGISGALFLTAVALQKSAEMRWKKR